MFAHKVFRDSFSSKCWKPCNKWAGCLLEILAVWISVALLELLEFYKAWNWWMVSSISIVHLLCNNNNPNKNSLLYTWKSEVNCSERLPASALRRSGVGAASDIEICSWIVVGATTVWSRPNVDLPTFLRMGPPVLDRTMSGSDFRCSSLGPKRHLVVSSWHFQFECLLIAIPKALSRTTPRKRSPAFYPLSRWKRRRKRRPVVSIGSSSNTTPRNDGENDAKTDAHLFVFGVVWIWHRGNDAENDGKNDRTI